MEDKKYICALAWIHAHIEADGRVRPCSMAADNVAIGSLLKQSFSEIYNSPVLKEMRVKMLRGELHEVCRHCHHLESLGQKTLRNASNEKFNKELDSFAAQTKADGEYQSEKIKSLDIRFSNLCNFKCRTCNEASSSAWYEDLNRLEEAKVVSGIKYPTQNKEQLWAMLEPMIAELEEVFILGGEPFLEPDHFVFLEMLKAHKREDIRLYYSTNFSTMSFRGKSLFEYWKGFKSVTLSLSYDGVLERAEFIRHGQNWQKTIEHHRELLKHQDIKFIITPTVSVLNVFHLPEMISYLIEQKMISSGEQVGLNILDQPDQYNVKILNEEERTRLKERYAAFLHEQLPRMILPKKELLAEQLNRVLSFIHDQQLDHHQRDELRKLFVGQSLMLNKVRAEQMLKILPELSSLFLDVAHQSTK